MSERSHPVRFGISSRRVCENEVEVISSREVIGPQSSAEGNILGSVSLLTELCATYFLFYLVCSCAQLRPFY